MRILFVTATRIGDAVLSTGLLDHLLRAHPGAAVTIACGPAAAGVFAACPNAERVIALPKQRFGLHWLSLWRAVAATRWDIAVDLRGSALTHMIRAGERHVMRGGRKAGHRIAQLGAVLGLDPPPLPVAWTRPADDARAAALLPPGAPVIGLGPTANWPGKVWDANRFVALFDRLAAADGPLPGARAAVFAGPGEAERALAAPVLAALPRSRTIDLAGTLTLPEAAAALARCSLYVGNDSGLMHLAAAAGAPTLGLFGPSPPEDYAPVGRRAAFVRTKETVHELVATPGYDHRTTGSLMGSLTVEVAFAGAVALLARVAAPQAAQ
ncbi:glycosyltransferase family 9 protein [Elioraea sp.]|uniref:glycosyltransferase family 9 protein n=1 Tax=Elioraea sp. TaxID=2185103 RepID=UPI0025BF3BF1|nr:glycosyltransferase family 9 protein [Elioraea sp.]